MPDEAARFDSRYDEAMDVIVAILFGIAAFVNLAPVVGFLSNDRIESLYSVEIREPNLAILMRHRALLFGTVGAVLLAAVFHPPLRGLAGAMGLFSMLSYVALVLSVGESNTSLRRIMWIDVAASLGLAIAIGIEFIG
jgi:hypothetical protein